MSDQDAPKIVVDSDWKKQARAEKEKLEAAEKQAAAARRPGAPGGETGGGPAARAAGTGAGGMPPADFTTLLGSMVSQALMYLGAFPDPETGKAIVSLDYARFHIDLLEVLEQKTRGNLTAEEERDMQQALSELRMRYVEISKAVGQMLKQRAAQAAAGGAGAAGGAPAGGVAGPGAASGLRG